MKYLIAGLGNIGPEYEHTRHNIGFMTMDKLAQKHDAAFDHSRHAFITEIKHKGRSVYLIKPTTYMNLSGKAVSYWMNELKIPVERLMVVMDDIALPFGKLRLRSKGSSAGHNGLKDIERALGSQAYPRLKFGIGDEFRKGQQVDYVLGNFSKEQSEELPFAIEKACDMIYGFTTIGIQRTMSEYND
ncbi:MAG: aminoacyl-tRNA hydrolase [Cyclobacteriaceae bacterium]